MLTCLTRRAIASGSDHFGHKDLLMDDEQRKPQLKSQAAVISWSGASRTERQVTWHDLVALLVVVELVGRGARRLRGGVHWR